MIMTGKSELIKGQEAGVPARDDMLRDMERIFDDYFDRGWLRPWRWNWPATEEFSRSLSSRLPRVDIIERDGEIVVKAEVPGVEKKDLDISMTDDSVLIKGSRRHERKEEKENYARTEITRGEFSRNIALPAAVDSGKARASYKDGILELVLPKREASRRKTIAVA
jgi:HSP20 family protein